MSWKVEVAANNAATSWTDITAYVDSLTAHVGGQGSKAAVGTGSGFDLDDDAGTRYVPGRRVIRVIEDATSPDCVVFRGRVSTKSLGRRHRHSGNAKAIGVQLDDYNQDLWGIIVDGQSRPLEPDWARMEWLVGKYLSGTASTSTRRRSSTNLDPSLISHTSFANLPAEDYTDTSPAQVISDIVAFTGKECFVTVDGELYYASGTDMSYAATISLTDSGADGIDSFAPEWEGEAASEDPTELLSGAKAKYGTDEHTNVSESRDAIVTTYDKWEEVVRFTTKSEAKAIQKLSVLLDKRGVEEKLRRCIIRIPAASVDRIKWGQTISWRAAAAADLTPVTLRVARLMWDLPSNPGMPYVGHLELAFPRKSSAAGSEPPSSVPPGPFVPPQTGIAGLATLHVADAVNRDKTWLYPGGTPAGRLVTGLQYKLTVDVLTNRYVDASWGYTQTVGGSASLVDSADNPTPGASSIGGWADPVGPGIGDPGLLIPPQFQGAQPGSHFETPWETYTGPTMDFDIAMEGQPVSGFYGHEATWRITLYVRNVDGSNVGNGSSPVPGQEVRGDEDPAGGDGTTRTGITQGPYLPGSLHVIVNGQDWPVTETSPATGAYELVNTPPPGATITREYTAAPTGTVIVPGPAPEPITTLPAASSGPNQSAGALQALIDATTTGEVCNVPFGTYHEAVTIDRAMDVRYNGSTITGDATRGQWVTVTADNVSQSDAWMIAAAPATASAEKTPQEGSLDIRGCASAVLHNIHTRAGLDCNLRLQNSPNALINGCSFNQAPRAGATMGPVANLVMRDSQFNDNRTNATYNPEWEAGGYKIGGSGSTNILIERVECSTNAGVGHWIDEHPYNVTIRDCWGHHNGYSSLMIEICHGVSVVRFADWKSGFSDGRGTNPGSGDWGWGAGILISSAGVVNVIDSVSAWSSAGITRINQGGRSNRESTVQLQGSGNLIAGASGRRISSWHQDGSTNQVLFTDASNGETGLRYYSAGSPYFAWNGDISAAAFAATRGGQGLTLLSSGAMATALTAFVVNGQTGVIPTSP